MTMNKKIFEENLPSIENILNVLNIGVSILDADQRFIFINKYALDHNGRQKKDFIGHDLKELQEKGFFKNPISSEVYSTKRPTVAVQQSVSSSGKINRFLVHGYPIFDGNGDIAYVVTDRISLSDLEDQHSYVEKKTRETPVTYEDCTEKQVTMIYRSPVMSQLVDNVLKVSDFQSSILLLGESGTGKDVMAQFIHQNSRTYNRNFVAINCASMPESLLESELFGYEKGAFTGAKTTGKTGLIESAEGGTLFLDEINSMPLSTQGKFLRVLESRTITRVGGIKPIPVNFRLIAATNESLEVCVEKKTFRADLYYRLNVIPFTIPPLRHRREDIRVLTDYFLSSYCEKYGFEKKLSQRLYRQLENRDWPGNIRELRNYIERLVVMTDSHIVHINDIPWDNSLSPQTMSQHVKPTTAAADKEAVEKASIRQALALNNGHRQRTADYLGISRRNLQYKIKKYGL